MKRRKLITETGVCCGIIALMLVSCLIDLCIKAGWFDALMIVTDDFQSAVFSGVLTFSTLSLTVISMIIGMMDTNLGGFKLRELLKFKSAPIRFSRYMTMSALLCVAAIPALAFELCTLMTVIALSALIYTTYAGILVFDLVSDPAAVRELILLERKTDKQKNWEIYIVRWIKCYKDALQNAELEERAHLSGLLADLIGEEETHSPENTPLRDTVSCQLLALLEAAAESMPFYEALMWCFDKLNLRSEKRSVCTEYLRRIRFLDAQQLLRFDLPGKLESLLAERYMDADFDHEVIGYEMIRGLNLNTLAGTVRDEALNECIRIMLSYSEEQVSKMESVAASKKEWSKKYGNDKKKHVLLMVFYNEIVMASEQRGATLYRELIQGLDIPVLMRREYSLEIVAEMFFGWYQDAKPDGKWNDERIKRSKKMVSDEFDSRTIGKINLKCMVSRNKEKILEYYSKQSWIDSIRYVTALRAWRGSEGALRIDMCEGIRFAYRFYLASDITGENSDFAKHLLERMKNQKKSGQFKRDCEALLKDFDPQTGEITAECMEDVLRMAEILDSIGITERKIRSDRSISMISVYQAITGYLKNFESGEVQE